MLQWMGGSRRKVATSRKSTQKRQKQYFEQKRRQQQACEAEEILNEENVIHQSNKNNRSLDVLSMLNLSAISQEHKFSAQDELEDKTLHQSFQTVQSPIEKRNNTVNPIEAFKTTEGRISPCYETATIYPKKKSVNNTLSSNEKASTENHERINPLKMTKENPLSMIDLLGDDKMSGNSEENELHEAHVAFSIEGLGKVIPETPIYSPNKHGRSLSYGISSPIQAKRWVPPIINYNCGSDTVEPDLVSNTWDFDLSPYASSKELPSSSRVKTEVFPNRREFSHLNRDNSSLTDLFEDNDELFYHEKPQNHKFWNENSSFPSSIFLDEEDYNLPSNQMDANFVDYLNIRNTGTQDFYSQGSYLHKKRSNINAMSKPIIRETPQPHLNFHEFDSSDETWDFKRGKSVEKELPWSYFPSEDPGQSYSLLSEESCSSTAARSDTTKKPYQTFEDHSFGIDNSYDWNERKCNKPDFNTLFGEDYDVRVDPKRHTSYSNIWTTNTSEINRPKKFRDWTKFVPRKLDFSETKLDFSDEFFLKSMSGDDNNKTNLSDVSKISNTLPFNGGKFESEIDVTGSNNDLSMGTEKSTNNISEFEKFSDCEKPTNKTPKQRSLGERKNVEEDAEDSSSFEEISNALNEKECHVSFPSQSGNQEVSEIQERRACIDPKCHILILESSVHQVVRVQMLKEASQDEYINKE